MHTDEVGPDALTDELSDLRAALASLRFPARHDDVLVELVTQHAPAHLVRSVGALSRTSGYPSLEDLCADFALGRRRGAQVVGLTSPGEPRIR